MPGGQSWSFHVAAQGSCRIEVVIWGHIGFALVARQCAGAWSPQSSLSFLYLHPRSCLLWRMAFADWSSSLLLGGRAQRQLKLSWTWVCSAWLGSLRPRQGSWSSPQLTSVDTVLHLQHLSPPEVCCVVLSAPSFFSSLTHNLSSSTSLAAAFT